MLTISSTKEALFDIRTTHLEPVQPGRGGLCAGAGWEGGGGGLHELIHNSKKRRDEVGKNADKARACWLRSCWKREPSDPDLQGPQLWLQS